VEALKDTKISKEVNGLRKHSSKLICSLAKLLVNGWKDMVNNWVKSVANDVVVVALTSSSYSNLAEIYPSLSSIF
jgi:cytoplasmic iron level regulating protein YaaA (DUF328/UPF0246 family)